MSEVTRRGSQSSEIAVLLVSGYASSVIDRAGAGSRIGFLEKPFTRDALRIRIHDLFADVTGG